MEEIREICLEIFKALADDTRLAIVERLSTQELCACEIQEALHLDITQPSLSYHMKILTDVGLISTAREGKWVRYTVNSEKIELLQSFLTTLIQKSNLAKSEESVECRC